MSTTSSKSSRKRQAAGADEIATVASRGMSDRTWRISALAIMVAGAFFRLYSLSLVPLHHDEGVNGNFLVTLVRNGSYSYDPQNYHGPTLYYFAAVIPWITRFFGGKDFGNAHGLTTYNIRLVTVIFGVGTIWLTLCLRKRLGSVGALTAAGLIAISPGAVYLSRYFIHEPLFVFFTLGIVVAGLKYYDTAKSQYLILAAISAALMTATKETWIINGPVLLIALVTTSIYCGVRDRLENRNTQVAREETLVARIGGPIPLATIALVAFTVFVIVNVLFYSSFFTNYPKGVHDALSTLNLWRQRTQEHAHPFLQYFEWLRQEESPVLLLGGLGALIAIWRANNRFAVFAAQWAFGLLVAYSLVTYKTPWIGLNFIVPLAIISGYALEQLYQRFGQPLVPLVLACGAIALIAFDRLVRLEHGEAGGVTGMMWHFDLAKDWPAIAAIGLLALYTGYILYSQSNWSGPPVHFHLTILVLLGVCGYQMYALNFVHYDDDHYPYVYAHTRRDLLAMLAQIDGVAQRMKTGNDTGIALVSPDYWPLPWYFRDYKRAGYYQQIVPTTEPIIVGETTQREQLQATFGERYQLIDSRTLNDPRIDPNKPDESFALRPGVDLLLYIRKDVAK